ncbi:hypothetical protein MMC19_007008 [Ptychographa xylographoides]|nr:hypothetical protein [Ptychographa xylographoides]
MANLLGNPHSASISSQLSTRHIENIRLQVLQFFNANPKDFDVIFVANATAGIKLVAESLSGCEDGFWYGYHKDAHTSLVGVREIARPDYRCFESDKEVDHWLVHGECTHRNEAHRNEAHRNEDGIPNLGLFAYPAQSNMNGRRLPLEWAGRLRASDHGSHRRVYTLLDAAALVSTSPLDLSDALQAPDFTVLSFNKIFGFPDLGALIVRKASGAILQHRKYFGGGTVEIVACLKEQWHIRKDFALHEQLEDGTLPIHSIIALDSAMNVHQRLFGTLERVSSHTAFLADTLYNRLKAMQHENGTRVCEIYKDPATSYNKHYSQGPIIALNLRNDRGAWISNAEVEKLATIRDIQFRSGGLCNPGGVASTLCLSPWEMKNNFSAGQRCGNENDIMGGKPTGMIRLSLGAMSTLRDVETFVAFVKEFFVDQGQPSQESLLPVVSATNFYVETLMIYPIKSCGGWKIPIDVSWNIKGEGLAWDREWCLVHQSSRAALSQKRYTKMALLRPGIDSQRGLLTVGYSGTLPPSCPVSITVPLSEDPALFEPDEFNTSTSRICGDSIRARIYSSELVTRFFTDSLGVPCYLARFPAHGSGLSARHAKRHLQMQNPSTIGASALDDIPVSNTIPRPILFSNESPVLIISRSSLNRMNETIKSRSPAGKAASAAVFRANIIIAEDPASPPGVEQPYVEDSWQSVTICRQIVPTQSQDEHSCAFEILGPCRRCQMICVDQGTGEKNEEPLMTLAKTRRMDGKVFFGVHAALVGAGGNIKVGDTVTGERREIGTEESPLKE